MGLFLSTYTNKVDRKGRVSVPALFRATLSSQNFSGIVAYGSFVHSCIEACGMDRIEQLSESIDNLDPYSEDRDAFATSILGGAVQLAFDGEGRVLFPEEMLREMSITDRAVFVGKGKTFEIWAPENFEIHAEKARKIASEKRANLRLHQQGGAS